ncbi:hypothetical protein [Deinococcus soli (ex Cha et al. 2016)]|uniref:3'-5' exonuclease n=1 Tax=Deinococcus soli (ex Cha et al. 2016) TaxID=1309411 RepID=UPI00166E0A70|nr:hypothetical protein [Deinococcus soli (ex Cha et al. 2016)]GGB70544.1 hypothetical protein GCM10008019_28410 [Deinococcus soli (ex Cha et al. 2016)]
MTQSEKPKIPRPDADTLAQQQADALATFQRWAADPLSLVVDTETTDLTGDAWEIAAGRLRDAQPLLDLRGEPQTPWSPRALELQAPDIQDQLRGLPHLRTHAQDIRRLLDAHHVLAYNAEFDHDTLERTCQVTLRGFECVMLAYAPLAARWSESRGYWKTVKLSEACELEGVPVERRTLHGARVDMRLTSELILAVARRAASAT